MDFSLSYELIELRNLVRHFVQDRLVPREKHGSRKWEWALFLAAMCQHVRRFCVTGGASEIHRAIIAQHAFNSR